MDMGIDFKLPSRAALEDVLPRNNVFGLSNSAFRSDVLRRCLPVRADVELVDWYLATRAWLLGAELEFEDIIRMDYRQHGTNMTQVRPPFCQQQIVSDCERVRHHYHVLRTTPLAGARAERLTTIESVASDVEEFYYNIVLNPTMLDHYVEALNKLELVPLWWSSVAHPALQHMWLQI